jgi:ribosomal protein L11 methyltransferase
MAESNSWLQLICQTTHHNSEAIEEVMESAGALSITLQDAKDTPVLEPLPGEIPLWDNLIIIALFESGFDSTPLSNQLNAHKDEWQISNLSVEKLENQDWVRVWMKDFHPMRFGNNLWIYPSNYEMPDDNSVKIHLDPGLAFGTGTHPTTALCLEWLDQNPPQNLQVVDYGCGSGILAVAAAKLGAKHICATDIDPQGLIATKENMQRNDISEHTIHCYLPDDCPTQPVDLVLANILYGPLLELFSVIASLTRSGGTIVLSGILNEQKDQVLKTYSAEFDSFETQTQDNWVRISATKI